MNTQSNERQNNAQRILDNQKERLNQNKGFGIGLLNNNFSIGKNSILDGQTIKMETLSIHNNTLSKPLDTTEKENSMIDTVNIRKESIKKENVFNVERLKKHHDEVEEITENKAENEIHIPKQKNDQEEVIKEEIKDEEIIKKFECKSLLNNPNNLNESDPKTKLYSIITSKDEIVDYMVMKQFLFSPLPKKTVFRCNIVRKKDGFDKAYPKYYVYSFPNERFLMAAKKRPKNSTPNYMITMNKDSFEKDNNSLGKLRSNFFGTEFNLYDTGKNPKDTTNVDEIRTFLAAIEYETNLFGLKGPRKMKVHLPGLTETESVAEIKNLKKGDTLFELSKKGDKRLISFRNKLPKWNERKLLDLLYIKFPRIPSLCSRF